MANYFHVSSEAKIFIYGCKAVDTGALLLGYWRASDRLVLRGILSNPHRWKYG